MRRLGGGEHLARPLRRIKIVGKGGTEEPFRIVGQKGNYFYILAKDVEKLSKVNKAYKAMRGRKVKPLTHIGVVGRGGVPGHRPFLFAGKRYLAIQAEELERVRAINEAYRNLLEKKRAGAKKATR